jgi:hypothetical protein
MCTHSSFVLRFTEKYTSQGVVLGLLLAGFLGCFNQGLAQSTMTQQVQLVEGWNMVSLHVRPDDASFDAVFEGHLDQITTVKNERGLVYVPEENIEQITSWKVEKGYLVYAKSAVTVEVSGTPVDLESVSVTLEKGGNVVPYLSEEPQAVEQALVSIDETLVVAEDEEGRQYRPSGPSSSLDSLRPGQGYTLYVDQPDTLSFPIVVNTLADALALQDVKVGRCVQVLGYNSPEDGGGGTFEVTDNACETDGGTCFVFDEDVSAEKTYVTNDFHPNLPDTDLVWGTFSARVGSGTGEVVQDLDMHGSHSWKQAPGDAPFIDFKGGELHKYSAGNLYDIRNAIGDGSNYDITYRYKTATSDRRLERQGVTNSVNIDWWGAPSADPNNPTEAWGEIGWALHVAGDLYQEKNIDWAYVDINGEYYYHHAIVQQDGTMLRGVGVDRSVPEENWTTNAKLTLTPGEAVYHQSTNYDQNAENDVRGVLAQKAHVTNGYLISKWGAQDIEIDGNYPNNTLPFNENDGTFDTAAIEGWVQNSGDWAGFHTNGAGAQDFASNSEMHWDRVHIHDMGGNGVATRPRGPEVYADKVSVGNMVRNHSVYHFNNTEKIKNISTYGSMWSPAFKIGSKDDDPTIYMDLRYHSPEPNPEGFRQQELVNVIGDNFDINGFEADLRGTNAGIGTGFVSDKPTSNRYEDVTIYTNDGQGFDVAKHRDSVQDDLYKSFTIYSNGSGVRLWGNNRDQGMTFEDITIEVGQNASGNASANIFKRPMDGKYSFLDQPARIDVINYTHKRATDGFVFKGGGGPDNVQNSLPRDLYIIDSTLPAGAPFFEDNGRWSAFGDTDDNFRDQRIYLVNTTIDLPASWVYPFGNNSDRGPDRHGIGSADGTTATFMLRDVQDHSGRVSDQTGSYTSDASDEGNDFVLISTNLIYRAWGRSATVTSGNRTVQSVEVVNSDGTLRSKARGVNQREPYLKVNLDAAIQAGNTITVDWEAHATPLDEYQKTGVFIGRPVYDKSFASGGGAFTVDLRGVLESQESKEAPTYTASSGDTSVVTANVQGDGYTLTLTEQGTGTATISVTGEVEGIGTATSTFEITVE